MKSRVIFAVDLCAVRGAGSYFFAPTQTRKSAVQVLQNRIGLLIANKDGVSAGISFSNGEIEVEHIEMSTDVAGPFRHQHCMKAARITCREGRWGQAASCACSCDPSVSKKS